MRQFMVFGAAVGLLCATLMSSAFAATKTWSGPASGGNWSSGANWGGSAPAAGDTVVFNSAVTSNADLPAGTRIAAVIFGASSGGSVINGSIQFNAEAATASNVEDNATGAINTINATLQLANGRTWFKSSTAGHTLEFRGTISGIGTGGAVPVENGIRVYGPGTVRFRLQNPSTNHTYLGDTTVHSADTNGGNGRLELQGVFRTVVPGDLIVGTSTTASAAADRPQAIWVFGSNVAGTSKITVGPDGLVELGAFNPTIAQLLGSGSVTGTTGTLTVGDAGNFTWGGVISGTGNVNKVGTGSMTLTAANTYTGITTVSEGTLVLGTPQFVLAIAAASPIIVGTGSGAANSAVLRSSASFQLDRDTSSASMTIERDGRFDLGGSRDILAAINLNGGSITMSSGELRNFGDIAMSGGSISGGTLAYARGNVFATSSSTHGQASISARIELAADRFFIVNSGTVQPELTISGQMDASFGSPNLIKSGTGTLRLAGTTANTYGGSTTIERGVLELAKPSGITAITGPVVINLVTASAGGFGKINTIGTVDFVSTPTPLQLVAAPGFTAPLGTVFEIVTNDGTDAVNGTFQGLPQGATVSGGATNFTISYTGGTGNDITLTVAKNTPVMTLSASANPVYPPAFGGSTTLSLTVATVGGVVPTGQVTFLLNGNPLPGCAPVNLNSQGVASCVVNANFLTAGTASVTASYAGDANYAAGSATPLSLVVADVTTPVLRVQVNGSAFGVVSSSPSGINCGSDCTEIFPGGTVVTLTATPNAGAVFVGWGASCRGRTSPCSVTVNGPTFATARFSPISIVGTTINIDIDGDGKYLPETDGLLITRWINGLTGPALTEGAVALPAKGGTATRVGDLDIQNYLNGIFTALDVNLSGGVAPTDATLILRYLFGFRGAALVAGVSLPVGVTAAMVEANMVALTPVLP